MKKLPVLFKKMVFLNREHGILYLHVTKACGQTIKATLESMMENENQPNVGKILSNLCQGSVFQSLFFHFDGKDVAREFPDANARCHTFIGVRNPYDRAYSLHQYCVDKADTYGWNVFFVVLLILLVMGLVTSVVPWYVNITLWLAVLAFTIYLLVVNNAFNFIRYNTTGYETATSYLPSLIHSHSSIFGVQCNYCRGLRVDTVLYEDDFPANFEALMEQLHITAPVKTTNVGASGKADPSTIQKGKVFQGVRYRYLDKQTPETIRRINELYREDFERFGFKMINPEDLPA